MFKGKWVILPASGLALLLLSLLLFVVCGLSDSPQEPPLPVSFSPLECGLDLVTCFYQIQYSNKDVQDQVAKVKRDFPLLSLSLAGPEGNQLPCCRVPYRKAHVTRTWSHQTAARGHPPRPSPVRELASGLNHVMTQLQRP